MIHLNLGDDASEPAELTGERTARLPAAIAAFNLHGHGAKDFTKHLDEGYQVAKAELRRRQHNKCAFCEKSEDAFKRPVEHFRPKKQADDRLGATWASVNTHYWWLAWSWTNLYFACDECNRTGHKGSRFPIEPGSVRIAAPPRPAPAPLPAHYFDVSAERPLLVDPRHDHPLVHIKWTPLDKTVKQKQHWKWTVEGLDPRGDATIEVLGLRGRIEEIERHLKAIQIVWHQIEGHLDKVRVVEANDAWEVLVVTYVEDPAQPFRGAAWCALDALCPAPDRRAHGFRDPPVPEVHYP